MTYTPTPAEIEAGAEALAKAHYMIPPQIPLSKFGSVQQQRFRDQTRAVLEAAAGVREVANG